MKSSQSVDQGWSGQPFTITVEFTCCEPFEEADCALVTVSLTIDNGGTPKTMAANLASAAQAGMDDANCVGDAEAPGGRQVQVFGISTYSNPGCTEDNPCLFPGNSTENQTKPYIDMAAYTYS